jgi:hypothetical protein
VGALEGDPLGDADGALHTPHSTGHATLTTSF